MTQPHSPHVVELGNQAVGGRDDAAEWAGSPGKVLSLVLLAHLALWTLIPALVNHNLPMDTVEAAAWGREWELGYAKHPPLSAWMTELFTVVLGRTGWPMYLLSSLCITSAIGLVYATARRMLPARDALVAALLLEGIYYHTFTSPEFNVNICIMPLLAGMGYALVCGLESGRAGWWIVSGACAGLAVLGKYTAAMLIGPVVLVVVLHPELRKSFRTAGPYLGLIAGTLIVAPHLWWIVESKGQTMEYAARRAGGKEIDWHDHLVRPLGFSAKMIGVAIPMLILALPLRKKVSDTFSKDSGDKKGTDPFLSASARRWLIRTLAFGGLASFFVMAALTGWKIRTMWAAPMFLFVGLCLVYFRPLDLGPVRFKWFLRLVALVLVVTPLGYAGQVLIQPMTGDAKRVHFPGPELAAIVSDEWHARYDRPLPIAAGEIFVASCVSYYADDRPAAYLDIDPAGAAWCDDDRLNREGGVLIHVEGDPLPADWEAWQERFPAMQRMPRLELKPTVRFGDPPPLQIDWAIIPPGESP